MCAILKLVLSDIGLKFICQMLSLTEIPFRVLWHFYIEFRQFHGKISSMIPGALFVKFLHCASGMVTHHSIPTEDNSTVLDIGNVRIDFSRGSFECYCNPLEIPQFTALSLALGTLLVLCIPRDKTWTPGIKVSGDDTGHVSPDDMKLAVGCGLHIQTPSNHYRFDRKS